MFYKNYTNAINARNVDEILDLIFKKNPTKENTYTSSSNVVTADDGKDFHYSTNEEGGNLIMEFDVPGFTKNDITITTVENILFINGVNETRTLNKEYRVDAGVDVELATATVSNGVLTITIPVLKSLANVTTISVK